jgi:MFS family permease
MSSSSVLKLPNFRKLYLAGATSELGSFITETVLMLFVFKLSGNDKTYLGILRATFLVFLTLGGILGGPIGNRFNRKKVLLVCEVGRIPLLFALFFTQNIWVIIACDAVIAFFTGIFRPSRQALINEIVPSDKIKKANGLFGSTNAILHLLGPLIGASIFGLTSGIREVVVMDLLTYAFGLYLLSRISYVAPVKNLNTTRFLDETLSGFSYIFSRKDLFAININAFSAGLAIGILIPLLVPFTLEVLGKTEQHYGVMMAFFGLGGIIGSWVTEKLSKYLPDAKLPLITIIIEPILFILFVYITYYPLSLFILFLWGMLVFTRITSQMNYISDSVETSFLTRVHATLEMSFIVPNISGGLLIALLGDYFSTQELLSWASILFLSLIFPRLLFPHMRLLWSVKPDSIRRDVQL